MLLKMEGVILIDMFITEELGVIQAGDFKIHMLKSSLSKFCPSRCLTVHAIFLAVTERAVPALCLLLRWVPCIWALP